MDYRDRKRVCHISICLIHPNIMCKPTDRDTTFLCFADLLYCPFNPFIQIAMINRAAKFHKSGVKSL